MIKAVGDLYPTFGKNVRIAENATVVGDVTLEEGASIWYSAILRADEAPIRIGRDTNIQDGAILHVAHGFPTTVGAQVTLGHGSIVHGCTVGDGVLVGMGAILLNGCVIGEGSVVAAGALVTEGAVIPPRSMVMGIPARVMRPLQEDELAASHTNIEEYLTLSAAQLPLAEEA